MDLIVVYGMRFRWRMNETHTHSNAHTYTRQFALERTFSVIYLINERIKCNISNGRIEQKRRWRAEERREANRTMCVLTIKVWLMLMPHHGHIFRLWVHEFDNTATDGVGLRWKCACNAQNIAHIAMVYSVTAAAAAATTTTTTFKCTISKPIENFDERLQCGAYYGAAISWPPKTHTSEHIKSFVARHVSQYRRLTIYARINAPRK